MKERLEHLWKDYAILKIAAKAYTVWVALCLTVLAVVSWTMGKEVLFESLGTSSIPFIIFGIVISPFALVVLGVCKLWEVRKMILPFTLAAIIVLAALKLLIWILKQFNLNFPLKELDLLNWAMYMDFFGL